MIRTRGLRRSRVRSGRSVRLQSPQTAYTALGDSAGSFTPLDYALGAGYARRVGLMAIGGGLKVIRSSLNDRGGTSAAVDLGALWRHAADLGDGLLDLGGGVSNLGPPLKLGSTADPLPLRARAGALWHPSPTFDVALDLVFPVDQAPYAAFGVEARFPAAMVGSTKPGSRPLRGGYDQSARRRRRLRRRRPRRRRRSRGATVRLRLDRARRPVVEPRHRGVSFLTKPEPPRFRSDGYGARDPRG